MRAASGVLLPADVQVSWAAVCELTGENLRRESTGMTTVWKGHDGKTQDQRGRPKRSLSGLTASNAKNNDTDNNFRAFLHETPTKFTWKIYIYHCVLNIDIYFDLNYKANEWRAMTLKETCPRYGEEKDAIVVLTGSVGSLSSRADLSQHGARPTQFQGGSSGGCGH